MHGMLHFYRKGGSARDAPTFDGVLGNVTEVNGLPATLSVEVRPVVRSEDHRRAGRV